MNKNVVALFSCIGIGLIAVGFFISQALLHKNDSTGSNQSSAATNQETEVSMNKSAVESFLRLYTGDMNSASSTFNDFQNSVGSVRNGTANYQLINASVGLEKSKIELLINTVRGEQIPSDVKVEMVKGDEIVYLNHLANCMQDFQAGLVTQDGNMVQHAIAEISNLPSDMQALNNDVAALKQKYGITN